jgi:UDP-N-acetylmuramyl pentapeptide synthase
MPTREASGWGLGVAVLNVDDPRVDFLASEMEGRCRVVRYGLSADSTVRAMDVQSDAKGLRFKVQADGKSAPFHCPYLLGKYHVYVLLPAVAIGLLKGMSLSAIAARLKDFRLPPGRMNRIEGIRGSLILDSSYNASPEATIAALEVLGDILPSGTGRRIAALGAMNELGTESKEEHLRLGRAVPTSADILVTVGKEARNILMGAQEGGMKAAQIHGFETPKSAAEYLKKIVRKGDVILAKGSQNRVRMEYLVHALMLHPEEAKEQLVRQEEYWQENA